MNGENISSKNRYWLLFIIQTLAGFASWIDIFLIFSVPSFVLKSTPADIAVVAALYGIPSLIIGPIFGVILDRSDPRKLMLWGAISRSLLTVGIAFAPSIEVFAALVFAKGLANMIYWPSSSIVTNQTIDQESRISYFSILSVSDQLTKIGTPMLAGLLAFIVPSNYIFLASAVATTICTIMLPLLFKGVDFPVKSDIRDVRSIFKNLVDGFQSFSSLPHGLLISIAMSIGISLTLAIYDPHLASFISSKGFDAAMFSIIVSSTGAGAVAAAMIVRIFFKNKNANFLLRSGVIFFSMAVIAVALIVSLTPQHLGKASLILLWFLNGFGYELFAIGASVNMQNLCPQNLLGRVSTSVRSISTTAVVIGPSLGAWLISNAGREFPFIVSAILALSLTIFSLFMKSSTSRSIT